MGRVRCALFITVLQLQEVIAESVLQFDQSLSLPEKQLCELALRVLDFERSLRLEAFEDFNQNYFALRMALADHYEHKSMSLRELHEGAWVGENVGLIRVFLDM